MTPQSLEEIYTKLEAKGLGGRNGVSERLIPGVGPIPCKIMFICEAPGADDDNFGTPFSGVSGKVFNDLLGLSGLKRKDVFVTNVFKYRPPGNRDPLNEEIRDSIETVSEEIAIVSPTVIVPMGKIALSVFLPGHTISSLRGTLFPANTPGRFIYPTYHPFIVLYDNSPNPRNTGAGIGVQKIRDDFKKLGTLLGALPLEL